MADDFDFEKTFHDLTGYEPFPWQREMYHLIVKGEPPKSCQIPTGLGKTSVIAIWLIALAKNPVVVPRRLVYVVNRRTVVDQSTEEAKKIRDNLRNLTELHRSLGPTELAISTLRGQFADDREWSADPSRPAVIVGTVDMIGSRLLFSGYGLGFKLKPLHAGFLGQDVLLIHDEAHLEPAFQELLIAIEKEQERSNEFKRFCVMELSATSREEEEPFQLTEEERNPPEVIRDPPTRPIEVVWRRLKAKKGIAFHEPEGDKEKVADRVGKLARQYSDSHPGCAVLVFVNLLEDVATVRKTLKDEHVQFLTGTLRGLERDRMADPRKETGCPIFARFLKPPRPGADEKDLWRITPTPGTVYLVCTSAGEVGIDITADHMVCDLTAFDRMAQRFGRVNRFGAGDANIDIVHHATPEKKEPDPNEVARWTTLELLKEMPQAGERRSASPLSLMRLRRREDLASKFKSAFTPPPTILPVSDILFDAWALTTIRDELPGRPHVGPYLHGVTDSDPPETHVAWREEVEHLSQLFTLKQLQELLDDYPIKPHELLRDRSDRVFKHISVLDERHSDKMVWVWLLDDDGTVKVLKLKDLADEDKRDRINSRTILLPPSVGGLSNGMLDGNAEFVEGRPYDVSGEWLDENDQSRRARQWENEEPPPGMRLDRVVEVRTADGDDEAESKKWFWFVRPNSADDDGSKTSRYAILWDHHTRDVEHEAARFADALLSDEQSLHTALVLAARFHDLGKLRRAWQRGIGNDDYPVKAYAKSGLLPDGSKMRPREITEYYRHEFGSLTDILDEGKEFKRQLEQQPEEVRDLVLHLIAAHHGRARPHFDLDEGFDSERPRSHADRISSEVPRRFARLQRRHGRWGLAYIESLLRAADYAASAEPSKTSEGES